MSTVVAAVSVNIGVTHHAKRFDFGSRLAVRLVALGCGTCLLVYIAVEHRRLIVAPYCSHMLHRSCSNIRHHYRHNGCRTSSTQEEIPLVGDKSKKAT